MNRQLAQSIQSVMSGSARGPGPAAVRAALAAIEPLYAGVMSARNRLYSSGILKSRRLARPVVSIGNITTGGTGKTPMIAWLAGRLRDEGRQVGVLSRGYRGVDSQSADELQMLDQLLNRSANSRVLLRGNPDRFAAGLKLIQEHPQVDVLLLDDGFQHRRLARDLDIVLISAADPFGYRHVLPRGLLREPLAGLQRAGAVVLTHADQAEASQLRQIEAEVRRHNRDVPIYRAIHAHTGLRGDGPDMNMDELARRRFFSFCGIGNPEPWRRRLASFGGNYAGHHFFGDHHRYSPAEIDALRRKAIAADAQVLITTEKDWVKIAPLASSAGALPIWRVAMQIQFSGDDESRLLGQIRHIIAGRVIPVGA